MLVLMSGIQRGEISLCGIYPPAEFFFFFALGSLQALSVGPHMGTLEIRGVTNRGLSRAA